VAERLSDFDAVLEAGFEVFLVTVLETLRFFEADFFSFSSVISATGG